MEEGAADVRRWEDLDTDVWVKILMCFDIWELTSGIPHVCSALRSACCDPLLWKTLDLSMLRSHFINIPDVPYVFVAEHSDKTLTQCSDKTLTRLLKISLNLSKGKIRTLVFHFDLYLSDEQLTYTAERCRELRRLVMPAWNRINENGILEAIQKWSLLESLTMASIANPAYLLEQIHLNCNNFCELKVMGRFDIDFASSLVKFLQHLKVLSLRCTMIVKKALMLLFDHLPKLEVLNISHCLLIEDPRRPPLAPENFIRNLDNTILERAARLCKFLTCMEDSCIMCQRTRSDGGLMRWDKYEEELWKMDEVSSLSLFD